MKSIFFTHKLLGCRRGLHLDLGIHQAPATAGDIPRHCWGASLRITGQDLAIHHYSRAKRQFCLMAHIQLTPSLCHRGGSSPPQPLQLHAPGYWGKQIAPVLGLTCWHSYSKPCFHIYNSFSNIFKQISHCWKNVKGLIWYV